MLLPLNLSEFYPKRTWWKVSSLCSIYIVTLSSFSSLYRIKLHLKNTLVIYAVTLFWVLQSEYADYDLIFDKKCTIISVFNLKILQCNDDFFVVAWTFLWWHTCTNKVYAANTVRICNIKSSSNCPMLSGCIQALDLGWKESYSNIFNNYVPQVGYDLSFF